MRRWAWLVVAIPLLAGCGAEDETPEGAAEVTSRAHPVALRAVAATVEALEGGLLEDGPLRRRVAAIAAEVAEAAEVEVASIAVLDSPEVIVRLLPGGHLQLSRGLLEALRSGVEGDRTTGEERLAAIVARALHDAGARDHDEQVTQLATVASSTIGRIVDGEASAGLAPGVDALVVALRRSREPLPQPMQPRPGADSDSATLPVVTTLGRAGVTAAAYPAALRGLSRFAARTGRPLRFPGEHDLRSADERETGAPAPVARAERLHELDAKALAQGTLLDAAELLARRGQPQKALELLTGVAGARAAWLRGLTLALRSDAEGADGAGTARDAERQLRTALVLDAGHVPARLLLGRLYLAQDRRENAREELLEAVRHAPLLAEAHLLLGLAQDDDEARRARLELARELDADGAVWRQAAAALAAPRSGPAPLDPRRRRLFGAGSER